MLQVLNDPRDVGGNVDVNSGQSFSALLGAEGHDPLQVHRGVDRVADDQGTPGIAGTRIFSWKQKKVSKFLGGNLNN